jgi:multicomponent Na+:H+ antiporter subunit E
MAQRISLVVALFVFWLLLSGHFTPFLLVAGLVCALAVTWFSDRMMAVLDREGHPIHLGMGALVYWPWLLWEIAKAAWDVSKRILSPGLPISPMLIRVKAHQKTDVGRVIYANSITLTPGTISVTMEDDTILVHALTREGAEGLESGDMDRRVCRCEGAS